MASAALHRRMSAFVYPVATHPLFFPPLLLEERQSIAFFSFGHVDDLVKKRYISVPLVADSLAALIKIPPLPLPPEERKKASSPLLPSAACA